MSDAPIPPDVVALLHQSFERAIASANSPGPARLRGQVLGNGTIGLAITGDAGTTVTLRLAEKSAREWAYALLQLATQARQRTRQLTGAHLWICWPDPQRDGVYLVKYDNTVRAFEPTTVRRPRKCTACGAFVVTNATMWRELEPKAWATPNWREVRLCVVCIRAPLPGEESGPGG